ncbi:MAG: hypothetical protein H6510_06925 [Acidobacteria bacterium]|nr:hypothetical protein [Acidobacteriota bacterium]
MGFLLQFRPHFLEVPSALLLALLFLRMQGASLRHLLAVALQFGLISLVVLPAFLLLHDQFFDSRAYHQPAIWLMGQGWNPLYQFSIAAFRPDHGIRAGLFIEHYAKSYWFLGSSFYAFFGRLEATKMVNFYCLWLVWASAYKTLKTMFPERSPLWWSAFALLLAANPVALSQLFSSYLDGCLGCLVSVFLMGLYRFWVTEKKQDLMTAVWVLPLLINIKFSGLLFAVVGCAVFLVTHGLSFRRLPFRPALPLGLMGVLSVFVLGFNPYVRNWMGWGHPFYPAVGWKQGQTVVSDQAPPEFLAKPALERFLLAQLGRPKLTNPFEREAAMPFSSVSFLPSVDARYGGFGPWFSGILLLSLAAVFWTRARTWLVFGVWIVLTAIAFPEAWWARYVPQIGLLPGVVVLGLMASGGKWRLFGGWLLSLIILVNAGMVLDSMVRDQARVSRDFKRNLQYQKNRPFGVSVDLESPFWRCSLAHIRELYGELPIIATPEKGFNHPLIPGCTLWFPGMQPYSDPQGEILTTWQAKHMYQHVLDSHEVVLQEDEAGLLVTSNSPGSWLAFSLDNLAPGRIRIFWEALDGHGVTVQAGFFWITPKAPTWGERSDQHTVRAEGLMVSEFNIRASKEELFDPLYRVRAFRFDPGRRKGRFVIHRIEFLREPVPGEGGLISGPP